MSQPPLQPRSTRLRPAGPLLGLFRRWRVPLWGKLAAGPVAADEETNLQAIARAQAQADRMVGLVQDQKAMGARSLWDQQVHDLTDAAVIAADRFKLARETAANQDATRALEAIFTSAAT